MNSCVIQFIAVVLNGYTDITTVFLTNDIINITLKWIWYDTKMNNMFYGAVI